MKKIAYIAALSLISGMAIADTTGSLAPSAAGATKTNFGAGDCDMIAGTNTFDLKASANVGLSWSCSPTAAAVIAGSTKGKYVYGGGTSGGGVHKCTTEVSTSTGYSGTISSAEGNGC